MTLHYDTREGWRTGDRANPGHRAALKRPRFSAALMRVEGRVVGLLVLHRGHRPKAGVEASVVVPIDPAGGGELDIGQGLVGAVVEDGGVAAFGLVEAIDALHQGVVVGVAGTCFLVHPTAHLHTRGVATTS